MWREVKTLKRQYKSLNLIGKELYLFNELIW